MCVRITALVVATAAGVSLAGGPPAAEPAVLHLTNGGYVPGELSGSDEPNQLRWRSPVFVQPLEFPLSAVKAVRYQVPPDAPKPAGEYCFELVNDDILYGDLLAVSDAEVELTSPRTGRVVLARDQIRRLYRQKGADSIYLGPSGFAGWDGPDGTSQWADDGRVDTGTPRWRMAVAVRRTSSPDASPRTSEGPSAIPAKRKKTRVCIMKSR